MNEPLDRQLMPAYDEEQIVATWQQIARARARRGGRRWLPVVAIPAVSLAVAAVVLGWRTPSDRGGTTGRPLASSAVSLAEGSELAPVAQTAIPLDDGSRLVLAPTTRLQVLANDGQRFATLLARGRVDFDVAPHGPRRWDIETALATIEVVGTQFTVEHGEHAVRIAVRRGVVMVRGERVAGRVQRLVAGQALVVGDQRVVEPAPPTDSTGSTTSLAAAGSTANTASSSNGSVTSAGSSGSIASRDSLPASSTAEGRRDSIASRDAEGRRGSIADVLAEADRVRGADPRGAARMIEDAVAQHPNDAAAGLASFVLGRYYLETLGEPERAATVFRGIVTRGTPRGLVEDAHARLIEALAKSGDAVAARASFEDYERRYPEGRWRHALRELLAVP